MTQLFQVFLLFTMLLCFSHTEKSGLPTLLYVTPDASIPCPTMPCLTLSQYIEDQDVYFGTDTELQFLPGVHKINNPFVFEGEISNTKLALVGEAFDQTVIIIGSTGEQVSMKFVKINAEMAQFVLYTVNYLSMVIMSMPTTVQMLEV